LAQHHRSDDILVFGIILLIVTILLAFLNLPFGDAGLLLVGAVAILLIVGGLIGRRTGRAIYGE
jgi:hypothetical protein